MTPQPPTDRRGLLLGLLASGAGLLLPGCGGGSDSGSHEAPAVTEFSADRASYFVGEAAQVQVRYRGATAQIEGLGPVANGQTVTVAPLAQARRLRLVVETPGHAPATRELQLDVAFRNRWVAVSGILASGHATAGLADGGVLVIGGSRAEPVLSRSVERWDPAERRLRRFGQMSAGRSGHSAVPLPGGQVLVCGGNTSENVAPFAELIDERTGSITPAGELAQPRNWHAACALQDGRVLMLGGLGRDSAELWDPATRRWRLVAQRLAHQREYASATLLPDGRVLVAGGRSTAEHYVFAELFDPRTETFAPVDNAITLRRQLHSAHALPDGKVLLLGGEDFRNGIEPLAEVLRFNPQVEQFTGLAPLATPRTLAASVLLPSGEVLMFGGQTPGAPATASAAAWRSDQQRELAPLGWPRQWHTANRLADGRVLVMGGDDGQGEYNPQTLIYE